MAMVFFCPLYGPAVNATLDPSALNLGLNITSFWAAEVIAKNMRLSYV